MDRLLKIEGKILVHAHRADPDQIKGERTWKETIVKHSAVSGSR